MDYGPPLVCLQRWLPDPADRRAVLWDTPARLFGFAVDPAQPSPRRSFAACAWKSFTEISWRSACCQYGAILS